MDCPACACLIDSQESACPFCGTTVRSSGAPVWLVMGLALGVGFADISCVSKGDDDTDGTDTVAATDSTGESSSSSSSSSGTGDTTFDDPSNGDGVTYAGPDEEWTTGDLTTTTGPNTTMDTTPDASTYAGPDEWSSTSDASTDSSSTGGTDSSSTGSTEASSTG